MTDLKDVSIKVRNYKCFADKAAGFERIRPINVIIGRNNSGKSALLDLVAYAVELTSVAQHSHRG